MMEVEIASDKQKQNLTPVESDEDDEDECRVCRGPAEEGRPLYKPCKCSGSIGLVHQDCLSSWLEITRSSKCELCSTTFKFAPKYAENTPEKLPPLEVISGVLHRAGKKWLPFLLRVALAALLWLGVMPLATAYLYFGWLHRPSSLLTRWKLEYVAGDTVCGGLVATVIIVSFLSLMSFADFLRIHWQQVNHRQLDEQDEGLDDDAEEDEIMDANDIIRDEDIFERIRRLNENDRPIVEGREDLPVPPHHQGLHRLIRAPNRIIPEPNGNGLAGNVPEPPRVNMVPAGDILGAENLFVNNQRENELEVNQNIVRAIREAERGRDVRLALARNRPAARRHDHERNENNLDRNENRLNQPRRRENRGQEQRPDPFNPANDPEDPMEMEIHMAFDELLGIRGPISSLFRNLMWLLAFNTTYLGLFAFIPHTVGISVYTAFSSSTIVSFLFKQIFRPNTTLSSMLNLINALNAESRERNTLLQLPDLAIIVLGYLSMASMVFLWQIAASVVLNIIKITTKKENIDNPAVNIDNALGQDIGDLDRIDGEARGRVPNRLSAALECAGAIVKVGILLFLKMLLLPLLLGVWLDAATLPLFNATEEGRIFFSGSDLFSSLLLHWVAGITFMLMVTVSVLQLREVAHPDLLAKAIRPQEPQPDLLGNLLQESGFTHARRMFLSLGIYALLLCIHIWLPSKILVYTGVGGVLPFFRPHVNYMFLPKLQIPVELLIFHLSVLAFLEKYKNEIGNLQHQFLVLICAKMNITAYVLPLSIEKFVFAGTRPLFLPNSAENGDDNQNEILSEEEKSNYHEMSVLDKTSLRWETKCKIGPNNGKTIDPFWKELAENYNATDEYILQNIDVVTNSSNPIYDPGITKRNGHRTLVSSAAIIHVLTQKGAVKIPKTVGAFRLQENDNGVIEFWREVYGEVVARPPEGWDDLGAGGAEVQGRWAWGSEKRSEIEEGVAKRKQFRESDDIFLLCLKLTLLFFLSWVGIFIMVCVLINTPLAIGRCFFYFLQIPEKYIHDPFGAVLGFMILFLSSTTISRIRNELQGSAVLHKIKRWAQSFKLPPSREKTTTFLISLFLWLVVCPTVLGVLYDLCFIITRERLNKNFLFNFETLILSWVSGTLLLNVWGVMCYFGAFSKSFWHNLIINFNENNAENLADPQDEGSFESWQGRNGKVASFVDAMVHICKEWEWERVDNSKLIRNSLLPMALELAMCLNCSFLAFMIVHYIIPFNMVPFNMDIGFFRMLCLRMSTILVVLTRFGMSYNSFLQHWFQAAHKAARDDRYLIGEQLLDYSPEKN